MIANGKTKGQITVTTKFRSGDYEAIHENPVWREKGNFFIAADIGDEAGKREWEQLWSRQIDDSRFEICCIPFFAYNLALGDEVKTDENYVIIKVTKNSKQKIFRVWFGKSSSVMFRNKVSSNIQEFGCEIEWSSENLLAISAPTDKIARSVMNFLHERHNQNLLTYEIGRTQ